MVEIPLEWHVGLRVSGGEDGERGGVGIGRERGGVGIGRERGGVGIGREREEGRERERG